MVSSLVAFLTRIFTPPAPPFRRLPPMLRSKGPQLRCCGTLEIRCHTWLVIFKRVVLELSDALGFEDACQLLRSVLDRRDQRLHDDTEEHGVR